MLQHWTRRMQWIGWWFALALLLPIQSKAATSRTSCVYKKVCLRQSPAELLQHLKTLGFRREQPLQPPLLKFHKLAKIPLKSYGGFTFVSSVAGRGYAIFLNNKLINVSFFQLANNAPTSGQVQEWYGAPTNTDTPSNRSIFYWYNKDSIDDIASATFVSPLNQLKASTHAASAGLFAWKHLKETPFGRVFRWNFFPKEVKQLKAMSARKPQKELQCMEGVCLGVPTFLVAEALSRNGFSPDVDTKTAHPYCKELASAKWAKKDILCETWSYRQRWNVLGQVMLLSHKGILKVYYKMYYENEKLEKSGFVKQLRTRLGKETWKDREGLYHRLFWSRPKTAAGFVLSILPHVGKPHPVSRTILGIWNDVRHSPLGKKYAKSFRWKKFSKSSFSQTIASPDQPVKAKKPSTRPAARKVAPTPRPAARTKPAAKPPVRR